MPQLSNEEEKTNSHEEIFEIARSLTAIRDVDQLLGEISGAVERLTHSAAASILLLDADKKNLVFKVATGEKGASLKRFYVPVGKGVAGWVAEKGEAVIVNDVAADERFSGQIDKSSGFSTQSILAIPMLVNGEIIGVAEALNNQNGGYTAHDKRLLESLSALAATAIFNTRQAEDNRNFFSRMIEIITMAVEAVDTRLSGHSDRVAELACMMARKMGIAGDDYRCLYYAALLHDSGLIAIHNLKYLPNVLSQTIERTPEKLHPLVGAELLKDIRLLPNVAPLIRHHHEYFDGSGHPDGLVGQDIPLGSRIITVAEAIDELQMSGVVGDALRKKSIELVKAGAETKFDPLVVNAYLDLLGAREIVS